MFLNKVSGKGFIGLFLWIVCSYFVELVIECCYLIMVIVDGMFLCILECVVDNCIVFDWYLVEIVVFFVVGLYFIMRF